MDILESLKEELLGAVEYYYIMDEETRRVIHANPGFISLCGPGILEMPYHDALKDSPFLSLFTQPRPESGVLNWELALEGIENYLLIRNRWVGLDGKIYRIATITCVKDLIGLSRELSGLTLEYQNVIKQNRELMGNLQWSAYHDQLTGLGNRNKYIHDSESIFTSEPNIGVLNLDVNNLKKANDQCGHACGDRLIRQVGSALEQLEENGLAYAYRVGGDEFLLVRRNCPPDYLDQAAAHILELIQESNRTYGPPRCEVAMGSAQRGPGQSFEEIQKLADDRMYLCKMQMKTTGCSG